MLVSNVPSRQEGPGFKFSLRPFPFGVWMFFLCLCRFSPSTLAFSPNVFVGLIGNSKLPVGVSVIPLS